MKNVTFITGNPDKAKYLKQYLGYDVEHQKLDLDEIQSLDIHEVVKHKLRQAYSEIKKPVLVEDVSLEFSYLGKLPGTYIKSFTDELGFKKICTLLDGKDRGAIARCIFGYFDGTYEQYFEGHLNGQIAEKPAGTGGYGWDSIFIPEGYTVTRAELNEEDDKKTYLQIKLFAKLKAFLDS